MPYIGNQPGTGVRSRFIYTATASQTTFTGADNNSKTLKYADSAYVDVFLNGVCLVPGTDYTASTKTSIVLTQAASLSDTLEVIAYDIASMSDMSASNGGTFQADVTFAAGADIITASAGTDNVRLGENAGDSITSGGANNVTVGKNAGTAITTGKKATLIGAEAGEALVDGDNNTAIGYQALTADTNGEKSVAVGTFALTAQNQSSLTDTHNTAVGYAAGTAVTTGVRNTIIGSGAGAAATTTDDTTLVGNDAGGGAIMTGHDNTGVGANALAASTSGSQNTAVGRNSGAALTTGEYNVLMGRASGLNLTDADYNVAIGGNALDADTKGSRSVAVGTGALGVQNFTSSTNSNNIAIGYASGAAVTTGTSNTFIGNEAGDATDDGTQNTAVGFQALSANCDNGNTCVGVESLKVATGFHNTALGLNAGKAVTSAGNCLVLGKDSGITGSPGGNITTGSNEIGLGDENIASFSCQVALSVASDARDKTDFTALDLGLDFVKALSPVTYKWDKRSKYGDKYADDYDLAAQTPDGTHKEDWLDVGFKAQEVEALEEAAGYKIADKTNLTTTLSGDGKQYGMQYEKFVPILVKAVQELSAKVDALETENTAIKSRLDALEAG